MNKITMISVITAALLFTGCGEQSKDSATDTTAKEAVDKAVDATKEAVDATKDAADKAVDATKEAASNAVDSAKEGVANATAAVLDKADKAVEATKEAATTAAATATAAVADTAKNVAGAAAYAKCAGCHGADGKTKALGKSPVIAGQSKEDLVTKIKAYKAGTRNETGMGTLMKGQVASMDDATIDAVATYISTLK